MTLNSNALTTAALLETELGLAPGANRTRIEVAINAASSQIDNYCGAQLAEEADIVEKVDGTGTNFLFVSRTPLTAISSITFDGTAVDSSEYEIHDAEEGSIYAPSGWAWTASGLQRVTWTALQGTERRLYEITYTAGHATIPSDLERAATLLAAHHYNLTGKRVDIAAERLLSWSATYAKPEAGAGGIPAMIAAMLEPYRSLEIA